MGIVQEILSRQFIVKTKGGWYLYDWTSTGQPRWTSCREHARTYPTHWLAEHAAQKCMISTTLDAICEVETL